VRSQPPPKLPTASRQAPKDTWSGVAPTTPEVVAASAIDSSEIDRWSKDAFQGQLSQGAIDRLKGLSNSDPSFTRANTLLFLDAKARNDPKARDESLGRLMAMPENAYNPVLLVECAQISIDRRQWDAALKAAHTAEQHWARLPSDLVFGRKAMIYEIEALAETGLYYDSDGADKEHLDEAIRDWDRYREHVQTKSRQDLLAHADQQLAELHEIQKRVE
jgi:hypothetical protein